MVGYVKCLGGSRSIHLSYGDKYISNAIQEKGFSESVVLATEGTNPDLGTIWEQDPNLPPPFCHPFSL